MPPSRAQHSPASLQNLPGVGAQVEQKLRRLGIEAPADLLFHLPLRYQDRTRVTKIGELQVGAAALVVGKIILTAAGFAGRRRSLQVRISDGSGQLTLRFFHFTRAQESALQQEHWVRCYGETRRGAQTPEFVHPEYRVSKEKPLRPAEATLTPVYPATEGLSANTMRRLVQHALSNELSQLPDLLPQKLAEQFDLTPIAEALHTLHNPPPDADTEALMAGAHACQMRLSLEELLAHHLAMQQLRARRRAQPAPAFARESESWRKLQSRLNFDLTGAQRRVIAEIESDLVQGAPGLRLLQGDVGSGKTVVAAAAALRAIDNRHQVALMAPTELLAEQHRKTFSQWLQPLGVTLACLTGKLPAAEQRQTLADIASGKSQMIIGTHALFQQQVTFNRLGFVIIDEQHRFGVDQRLALRDKSDSGVAPHQLIMSATPIPRSMAMIFYADLDVSNLDEMPPGRLPVATVVLNNRQREKVAARIRENCLRGNQAYWVCPLIDESEKLQAQAATETFNALQNALPDIRIELIHGRLKAKQKDEIMQRFGAREIDLLVATSVIEVGVDVPSANLMVIENAERLGLAQLHQLRGRVGRGAAQASCVLLYQSPLGQHAKARLALLRDTNDGFVIAEKDLQQRGPGEMLGTRQTGLQRMKVADLHRDRNLLPVAVKLARVLQRDYPDAAPQLVRRWVSQRADYANV